MTRISGPTSTPGQSSATPGQISLTPGQSSLGIPQQSSESEPVAMVTAGMSINASAAVPVGQTPLDTSTVTPQTPGPSRPPQPGPVTLRQTPIFPTPPHSGVQTSDRPGGSGTNTGVTTVKDAQVTMVTEEILDDDPEATQNPQNFVNSATNQAPG